MNEEFQPRASDAARKSDPIRSPARYVGRDGLEARRVIEDAGLSAGFYLGNAIKYVLRAGHKFDADAPEHVRRRLRLLDLCKARRNLEMLAEVERGTLTGSARRSLAPGYVAAQFGLGERLACVIAILTMPHLHVSELGRAIDLLAEEIYFGDDRRNDVVANDVETNDVEANEEPPRATAPFAVTATPHRVSA